MSLQEEIVLKQEEIKILKEMQATNYNEVPIDTLFMVASSLDVLVKGEGTLSYFASEDADNRLLFFPGGQTSATNVGPCTYARYCKRVVLPREDNFRKWLSLHMDTKGKLHFHRSEWPRDLPTNYSEIAKGFIL